MKIIVYGTGKRGIEFIQCVREFFLEIEIVAISDTYKQKTNLHIGDNISFIEASSIQECIFDYVVVTPKDYFMEIKEKLLAMGINREKIKSVKEIKMEYAKSYCNNSRCKTFYCDFCNNSVPGWEYIGCNYDIFATKKIIGASKRRGKCPICESIDRERYIYYILKNYTSLLDGVGHHVLHFAPEECLSQTLKNACGAGYISADIAPKRADIIADITKLQFAAETFEYIICNHVMEHIPMEWKAFEEIKRCLIQGGVLILTVPICWEQKTFEDDGVETEEDRVKYYGQKDHVRLYGNDVVERIEKFGFDVTLLRCNEVVNKKDISRFGFISEDSVLLCKKI